MMLDLDPLLLACFNIQGAKYVSQGKCPFFKARRPWSRSFNDLERCRRGIGLNRSQATKDYCLTLIEQRMIKLQLTHALNFMLRHIVQIFKSAPFRFLTVPPSSNLLILTRGLLLYA
jgi:hypothetical protein